MFGKKQQALTGREDLSVVTSDGKPHDPAIIVMDSACANGA